MAFRYLYLLAQFLFRGIYGRKYPPSMIPAKDLTHILYAFANIKPDTGGNGTDQLHLL